MGPYATRDEESYRNLPETIASVAIPAIITGLLMVLASIRAETSSDIAIVSSGGLALMLPWLAGCLLMAWGQRSLAITLRLGGLAVVGFWTFVALLFAIDQINLSNASPSELLLTGLAILLGTMAFVGLVLVIMRLVTCQRELTDLRTRLRQSESRVNSL